MGRIALVARLKPGTGDQAAALIDEGPPFDPADAGFSRHEVYLSAGEVVFVFEGDEVEWILDEMVGDPGGRLGSSLAKWRELVEDPPRIARAAFAWERSS